MRKFVAILLILVISFVLFAQNKIVIWSSEKQVDFLKKIGEQFTKDTGILVEVQQVNFGDIKTKFITAAQAGEGPEIIVGAHDWVGELVANGLLEPIPTKGWEINKYAKSALNAFTVNGKLYGLPYAIEAVALLYNKDYVEEPPKNIEELIELAKEISGDELVGFIYDAGNFYFSYGFIAGYGGYVFKWDPKTGYDVKDIGLANEGAIKGAKLIKRFFDEGIIPTGANYGTMDSMFKEGLAAMIINGPWAVKDYIDAGIDFGVLPLTKLELEEGKYGKPFVGVQGLMVNALSPNKSFAIEFLLKYLSSKEAMYEFYKADPRLPSRGDVVDLIKAKGGPVPFEIVKGFTESAAGGEPMPNVPEMGSVWGPMGDALSQIINNQLDPETAMKEAVTKIKTAIGK